MYLRLTYCRGNGEKISANTDPGYSGRSRKTEHAQQNRLGVSRCIVMRIKKAAKTITYPVSLPLSGETVIYSRRQNRL
jgi:hypothetical protein